MHAAALEQVAAVKGLLAKINEALPDANAVCLGGFPRDVLLSRAPKDVDIWITHHGGLTANKLAPAGLLFEQELSGVQSLDNDDLGAYCGREEILGANEFSYPGLDIPVQIIELQPAYSPMSVVELFDFGLCRAGMTKSGRFIITPEFLKDAEDQTLTLLNCADSRQFERSMIRAKRLVDRAYPSFRVLVPGEFQDFAEPDIEFDFAF